MTKFSVPEMSCAHCKASIEKAIASQDPEADVSVDLAAREIMVYSTASVAALIAAMKVAGYEAHPAD